MAASELLKQHEALMETGEYGGARVSRALAVREVFDRSFGTTLSLRLCSNVIYRISKRANWQTAVEAIQGTYDDPMGVRVVLA